MSPRPKARADVLPDGDPDSIVRRAPFADSPFVGERGQKAQARILEAALQVFGEVGYHGCGIKRITELSGYSRASFYQYFSSKEDLFRHLAGRVARELIESADQLAPVTADRAGWQSFHEWLTRYAEIYDRYEPVFVTFQTAAASDEMVASGASIVADRNFKDLRSKIEGSPLTSSQVDSVVRTLLRTVSRLNREAEILELVTPLDRPRVALAYADVFHRALFGPNPDVNVHGPKRRPKSTPRRPAARATRELEGDASHGPAAQRTRAQLLEAGHSVFVERGFYATRVADVVAAAGVSHGVFYRYFDNKAHLFRILAERSSSQLAEALDGLPAPGAGGGADPEQLRDWLQRYADTYASEAAIFVMWQEAISRDPELAEVSAEVLDRSRRQLQRYLEPRGWGDVEADALVFLVLLDGMTSPAPKRARIEAFAEMIERGLLTAPASSRPRSRR